MDNAIRKSYAAASNLIFKWTIRVFCSPAGDRERDLDRSEIRRTTRSVTRGSFPLRLACSRKTEDRTGRFPELGGLMQMSRVFLRALVKQYIVGNLYYRNGQFYSHQIEKRKVACIPTGKFFCARLYRPMYCIMLEIFYMFSHMWRK